MKEATLISLNDALNLSAKDSLELNKSYLNLSLIKLLSVAGFAKYMTKAIGTKVYDSNGTEYTDFLAGFGSLNIGHNHPQVFEAIEKVKDFPNLLQICPGSLSAVLANNLAAITPGNLQRSFFCNSGAEAVEAAIKLARIATGKKTILSASNSFHGKTLGALTVTGKEKYRENFTPLLPDVYYFPFNDIPELEIKIKETNPAAIILEPVQGEGGVIIPEKGYLSAVRTLCNRHNVLLILDEIQTGLGRTGKMFACDHEQVVPDIMCLAKSLSGGVIPIGAIITSHQIWQDAYGSIDKAALHTSTFGGNTFASAAAIATIEVILQNNLLQQSEEKGNYFLEKLKALQGRHALIKDIRGIGLFIGIELSEPRGLLNNLSGGLLKKMSHEYFGTLVAAKLFSDHHIITAYTLNNPNVIRVEPSLTINYEEIDHFIDSFDNILKSNTGFLSIATSTGKRMLKDKL